MILEQKLKSQQAKVFSHQQYFIRLIHDNRVALIATLLPAFIWGWKQAREKDMRKTIPQIFKFIVVSALSTARKKCL